MEKRSYHWFTSSWLNWCVDDNLRKVLNRQHREDTRHEGVEASECNVWKVPGSKEADYHIDNYAPQVEGAEFIEKVVY